MINELREGVKNIVRRWCPESGPFWSADIPPHSEPEGDLKSKIASSYTIDFKKKNSNVAKMMKKNQTKLV